MKPLRDYLIQNFEKSTLAQIADEYKEKGYTIRKNVLIGPFRVDLAAIKDDEIVYIELKTHTESFEAKQRIKVMADYFKNVPKAKFRVVISRFPEIKKIDFYNIDSILYDYFILDFPSALDELSTHTSIEEVYGVDISEISIKSDSLYIICDGKVEVSLQYGSDLEQDAEEDSMCMSFPFKFKGVICHNGKEYKIKECEELEFDTDAFYE